VRAGRVLVGVHSEDPDRVDKGEQILRKLHPLSVEHFDARGRAVYRD